MIVGQKPLAWIDVDGVLLNFNELVARHLNKLYGLSLPENFIPKDWNYLDVLPPGIQFSDVMKSLPDGWEGMLNAYEGAEKFTRELKRMGAEVVVITQISGVKAPDRIKCLIDHNITFDEVYFTLGRKKSEFASQIIRRHRKECGNIQDSFIVDDKAENTVEFLEEVPGTKFVVTANYPYNSEAIEKCSKLYSSEVFNFQSKNPQDMYETTLARFNHLLNKEGKKK